MTISEFSNIPGAPNSTNLHALSDLAEALDGARFFTTDILELLGEGAFSALQRDQIVPAQLRVEDLLADTETSISHQRLALVTSFFLLGRALTEEEINSALSPCTLNTLQELGLAEALSTDEQLPSFRASVDLRPHSADDGLDIWVASDLPAHIRQASLRKDHVLGIGHASRNLVQFTERRPVKKALDLGTGCGIQTFHLLAHCEYVIATDISERALAFCAFNLLLNADRLNLGQRVDLRLGSLLEPVQDETFDLVVSNPPFVITPRKAEEVPENMFTYRDGGLAGDQIVSTLVKELPTVLKEGGRAQMLGNWEIPLSLKDDAETDWSARPRHWVGENCEAWFIQREELAPQLYAETWLRDSSETSDQDAFATSYRDYLQDFTSRAVGSIGLGMIWMRKAPQDSPVLLQRFEEISYPLQQPLAPFLTEAVENFDSTAHLSDDELLNLNLYVAEDVTEERHARPGAEHPGVILLRQGAGFRRTVLESTATAGFVSACDGELSVGQILGALAALLGWEGGAERDELLGHVRELLEKGFLRIDTGN